MLLQIFKAILFTSLVGSVLAIILLLLKPITKRCFGSAWQYYAWAIVLVVMMLPVTINLPQAAPAAPVSQTIQTPEMETTTPQGNLQAQNTPVQATDTTPIYDMAKNISLQIKDIVSYGWLIGCLMILALNIIRYAIFLRTIRKNCEIISCPEIGTNRIITRRTDMIHAPLMVGLFRSTLLLPNHEITEESLNYILRHELTHYRRCDLWYKWFAMLVRSIHWFNPIVYVVSKQIDEECEISCDLSVVANMNEREQKNYMHTILSFVTQTGAKPKLLTTAMASSKKAIKRRVVMIKNFKKTKKLTAVISVITACLILTTTIFASGVLASEVLSDDYTIEVYNGENLLDFTNKPFMENGEIYLPLRETLEHTGVLNHKDSTLEWDNGTIIMNLACDTEGVTTTTGGHGREEGIVTFAYSFMIKIGDSAVSRPPYFYDGYQRGEDIFLDMNNEVVLKNSTTYVPCQFFMTTSYYIRDFENLTYTAYDKDGNILNFATTSKIKTTFQRNDREDIFIGTPEEQDAYNPVDENGNRILIDRMIVDENGKQLAFVPKEYQDPETIKELRGENSQLMHLVDGYTGLHKAMIFRNEKNLRKENTLIRVPNTDSADNALMAFVPAEYQY